MGCGGLVYWQRLDSMYPSVTSLCPYIILTGKTQVLLLPTIFAKLEEKTLYLFGAVNAVTILVVWALYPETNQRTLEEMNLVFASDSIWNWEAERNFKILKEQNPELVQAAERGNSVVDPETGIKSGRQGSLVPRNMSLEAKEYGNGVGRGDSSEEEKEATGVTKM